MKRVITVYYIIGSAYYLMYVRKRRLIVRTRKDGSEYVMLKARGKRIRVTLDTKSEIFVTRG